jgi:hypothetical protein
MKIMKQYGIERTDDHTSDVKIINSSNDTYSETESKRWLNLPIQVVLLKNK